MHVSIEQQSLDDGQHRFAGRREAGQALAGAHEDLDAQLVLQLADLPAHARLRGVQHLGHHRQVEALADGLAHRAELLEVHGLRGTAPCLCEDRIMGSTDRAASSICFDACSAGA